MTSRPLPLYPQGPVQVRPASRRYPVIAAVAGTVATAALLGSLFVGGDHGPEYTVGAPQTAGGLRRDQAAEAQLEPELAKRRSQFDTSDSGDRVSVVSAYYLDPKGASAGVYPAGVMFIGGTAEHNSLDTDELIAAFKRGAAKVDGPTVDLDPGPHGGKAACRRLTLSGGTVADCVWATRSSFGYLVAATKDSSMDAAAAYLRSFRPDVEKAR